VLTNIARAEFIFWQGETPPASGVPSAQWFFDPDSWVGGVYPGAVELPPNDRDIARYQFRSDVTPVNDTWIVQLGTTGPNLPASHTAAYIYPGNWEFRFESPGAPGAPPIPAGSYTLTGFPGGSLIVGNIAGATDLTVEGYPTTRHLELLTTDGTTIAVVAGADATLTLSNATWREQSAINIGYRGTGALNVESGGRLITNHYISLGQGDPAGHGSVTISDGGRVSASYSHIASVPGSSGDAVITGEDSEWINFTEMVVGYGGHGTMTITEGAGLRSARGFIGLQTGSIGNARISGVGSSWITTDYMVVGDQGQGTLTIDADGQTVISGHVIVGSRGQGTLMVQNGGGLTNTFAHVGDVAGGVGTAIITGVGSTWIQSDALIVGQSGNGALRVEAGALVSNTFSHIASQPGSLGSAVVTGAGSTWTNSDALIVGHLGDGTLRIEDGATVTNTFSHIASQVSPQLRSTGSAIVTGMDSSWTLSDALIVGHLGDGTLRVEAGAMVSNTFSHIASQPGSTGSAVITGMGSQWTNSSVLTVGHLGIGELQIRDGAKVASTTLTIGSEAGSVGRATVIGNGSQWTHTDALIVGHRGDGTLLIEDGAEVSNGLSWIGPLSGGTGSVTVTGAGSKWVSSYLAIANDGVEAGGTASLIIRDGGSVEVGSRMRVASTGTIDIDNGSLNVTSVGPVDHNFRILDEADSDANVTIRNGGDFVVAANAVAEINGNVEISSNSSMTLGGQSTTAIRGRLRLVGNANVARATVQDNATLIVDELEDVRFDNLSTVGLNSTVRLNAMTLGGTQTPPPTPTQFSGNLQIGHSEGSGGTSIDGIEVSGEQLNDDTPKVLNVGNELVAGFDAPGVLRVRFGGDVNSKSAWIAKHAGSDGTVIVAGTSAGFPGPGARLNVEERMQVGGLESHAAGGSALLDVQPGGGATVGTQLHLGPNGTVQVDNFAARVLVAPGPFDNGSDDGVVEVYEDGMLSGNGLIRANVLNHGLVSPGASAGRLRIEGDYLQDEGVLSIEIGGTTAGTQFDQLIVDGAAELGGTLEVNLIDGFSPRAGSSFAILTATDGIEGNFNSIELPNLSSGKIWSYPHFDLQGLNSFILTVLQPETGDYNGNGIVDTADFIVWRKTMGQFGGGLAADGNGNGQIDSGDYDVWRTNFGRTVDSASSASTQSANQERAVPEPATLFLALFGGAIAICLAERRRMLRSSRPQ
jgi:T5SS/PEP-CTERM-associated repeat protein